MADGTVPYVTALRTLVQKGVDASPTTVHLEGGGSLTVTDVLRHLPGRRITVRAMLEEAPDAPRRDVVVKAYAGDSAERNLRRELNGLEALQRTGVGTPLAEPLRGAGCPALCYAWIPGERFFDNVPDADDIALADDRICALATAVGQGHRHGVLQRDTNLDNFVWGRNDDGSWRVTLLDGARVSRHRLGIDWSTGLANLAALLAETLPEIVPVFEVANRYIDARSDLQPPDAAGRHNLGARLEVALRIATRARLAAYAAKVNRTCSDVLVQTSLQEKRCVARTHLSAGLTRLLDDPDKAIAAATKLKEGGSATVARIDVDVGCGTSRALVIKRYNTKSFAHGLRINLRHSRAHTSWCAAHVFGLAGLRAARPVALLERRIGPWVRTAYLVMENAEGAPLDVAAAELTADRSRVLTATLRRIVLTLEQMGWRHGDMKADNFVVDLEDDQITLLDLDAAKSAPGVRQRRRLLARDVHRLVANWPTDHPLGSRLREAFARFLGTAT